MLHYAYAYNLNDDINVQRFITIFKIKIYSLSAVKITLLRFFFWHRIGDGSILLRNALGARLAQ